MIEDIKTDSMTRKEHKKHLASTFHNPFSGQNRRARRSKLKLSNKKHTAGRLEHNKIRKHLNNAI